MASETEKCRERLKKYCVGNGLDLGYGGDPIVPTAITVDLEKPYTDVGDHPQNLKGDARNLYWFRTDCLDYVFSSHLFEDFSPQEMQTILWEWVRVLKPGGYLVLYLPDEQAYRKHCKEHDAPRNTHHEVENFSLEYFKSIVDLGPTVIGYPGVKIVHENALCDEYCFEVVLQKGGLNV